MKININLSKKQFSVRYLPLLDDWTNRFEIYCGSAGSGKSYFITQKILKRALTEQIRVLVCRRYGSTLRQTCFALFKDVLNKWKLTRYCRIRETDFHIDLPNGSEIIFTGLDDEQTLLSLVNITVVFVEEVYEVPQDIFEQLNLRLRGGQNQVILAAFNPISSSSWLYKFCIEEPPQNLRFIHSTYKDNPFLSAEYVKSLEELKERNPQKWRIYGLGEWGTDPEGLVFTNWEEGILPLEGLEHRCGMDFGYRDPSALVSTFYDQANHLIYVEKEFYAPNQTLEQLAAAVRFLELQKSRIQCDSASPMIIDYLRRQGFNAVPCVKGQNSVAARLAFLQNNKIVVNPACTNVLRELSNFSYIKDKKSGLYTEDTTHEFSHSLDALGYAYSDLYTKAKLRTIDKSILGL